MSLKADLAEIERRVSRAGLSVHAFLLRLGIPDSTFQRWKRYARGEATGSVPRMNTFNTVHTAARRLRPQKSGKM